MSAQVAFVGGPWDGQVRMMPEPLSWEVEIEVIEEREWQIGLAAAEGQNKQLMDMEVKTTRHRYRLSTTKKLYIHQP